MAIEELPDPRVLLAETDWNTLGADWAERVEDYPVGPVSFTPMALAAFTCGDRGAVTRGLNHLSDALLHQGSLYGETGTAALYIAALLADPGSQEALVPAWEAGRRPLRAKLLDWLAAVADTVSDAMEEQREEWGLSWASSPRFREVCALRPALFQGVSACLADSDPVVREAAIAAAVPLLDAPELVHHRAELIPVLRSELAASSEQGYRLVAIVGLQAWGEDTTTLAAHAELIEYEHREKEWEEKRSAQGRAALHGPRVDDEPPF
ncbi:hypothetical protein [Actinomadura sp. HBU206391]|uniref:hypothetical protein n=1 Tax=Actinomadura sp. HBU206391 TaxID=2731692 RepID=UPI0016501CA4|nr:hypothetical protein [Actinomadura sp. HBU206391]MBC6460789.1 hypothetical protein [Actinomadura sp. HBU206391]